jgi:hypothetical protein
VIQRLKSNRLLFIFAVGFISACGTPTLQPTPQLVNVYITSAAYSWVSDLYNCTTPSSVINLTGPNSADVTIRLGEPADLTTPAFQISTEDILVITHPQTGIASLNMEQVRSIFLGQTLNWKEVGGNDLAVQVWSFSPGADIQETFNKVVMHGDPVTSTARLAVSSKNMADAVKENPGSIGVLPRHFLTDGVENVFTATNVPVLAITQVEPTGVVNGIINCLQQGSH